VSFDLTVLVDKF